MKTRSIFSVKERSLRHASEYTYNKAYKKLSCKKHRVDWEELNEVVERVRKKPGAIKGGDDHGDALNLD